MLISQVLPQEEAKELLAELLALFSCQSCGKCCDGSIFKNVEFYDGIKKDLPCVYYKDSKCLIHSYKPEACKAFPVSMFPNGQVYIDPRCDATFPLMKTWTEKIVRAGKQGYIVLNKSLG
jgi:Fe-S-cluster containining protein